MVTEAELTEYLEEMRTQVCSHCVERPPGGPPCAPLGKNCGVEMHLAELVESIQQDSSRLLEPYLERNRKDICQKCAFLESAICPCPMDYLAALVVEAVETVDERHREREQEKTLAVPETVSLEDIRRAFDDASGTWTGCDWPTHFGKTGLNLKGWTPTQAAAMALETLDSEVASGSDLAESVGAPCSAS